MVRRRAVGAAAFAGAAVGGVALGYLAERRAMRNLPVGEDEHRVPVRGKPMEVVAGDGTVLHAEAHGDPGAPTIILAHGVGLSSAIWHHQCAALSDRYRLVTYDHRGHGGSQRADDCSIPALGQDLAAVIRQCEARGRVVVAGHSMGGIGILSAVEQVPDLVERQVAGAVLCNTTSATLIAGAAASSAAAAMSIAQARLAGSRLGSRTLLRSHDPEVRPSSDLSFLLTRQFGMTRDAHPDVVTFLERQLRACPPIVLASFAPGLATVNLRDAARSLRLPALVIVGGRDRITAPRQGRRLAEELPDAELVELPDVGHTAMLEAPGVVSDALAGFADRVLGRDAA